MKPKAYGDVKKMSRHLDHSMLESHWPQTDLARKRIGLCDPQNSIRKQYCLVSGPKQDRHLNSYTNCALGDVREFDQ
jgi:hypothetical protein